MNFSEYYFTEAKLSALRQIKNLFSKEKEININVKKDLVDKGYFGETNESTFSRINESLAHSYKEHIQLVKSKKIIKHREDKVLTRMKRKKEMELEAGNQIINVFNANITDDDDYLGPYTIIQAAVAYETGRSLLHYGYIVLIIASYIDLSNKYFVGADKLGMKFFKEMFGTNIDMYISSHADNREYKRGERTPRSFDYLPKEDKPKQPLKNIGYVIPSTSEETKKEFFKNIKETWGTANVKGKKSSSFSDIKAEEIIVNKLGGKLKGYTYELDSPDNKIGVYVRGEYGKEPSAFIIIFYGGQETVNKADELNLFDNLSSITPKQLFSNINYVDNIANIKKI